MDTIKRNEFQKPILAGIILLICASAACCR